MPFPFALARRGAKPLEPFGKGSDALKAGTPDAGPEGPTLPAYETPIGVLNETWSSVQPPAGVERNGALYARPARKGKAIEAKAIEGQREGLVGPWISSASRTASSTPSRICLAPVPATAGALRSFFMPASRGSMVLF